MRLTFVKAIKIGILIGIVIQTFLEDVLPITQEPLILRIVGAAVYTAGLLVAILARLQLADNWTDIENGQVLSNHIIVSNGLYRYIRHPIYIGDLLLLLGLELSLNSWLVVALGLIAPVVLWKAVREERILIKNLPGYAEYCKTTDRFIPFVI
jgi:protein-S-isoprenylcysteine O-methyltransferase Ste14